MKKKLLKAGAACLMLLAVGIFGFGSLAKEPGKSLDVLFMHDTHSHLNEFATVENGARPPDLLLEKPVCRSGSNS